MAGENPQQRCCFLRTANLRPASFRVKRFWFNDWDRFVTRPLVFRLAFRSAKDEVIGPSVST